MVSGFTSTDLQCSIIPLRNHGFNHRHAARLTRNFPVASTQFQERYGQFSPDGKWVAYQSDESGQAEIYAQPFPGPGPKVQISTDGGAQVRWRKDGKELFYTRLDGQLMAVPIHFDLTGKTISAGSANPLFATRIGSVTEEGQQYVVSDDGQRFLMRTVFQQTTTTPITAILNLHLKQ